MNICIKTIPYKQMRYPSCGDYYFLKGVLHFRVANLGNWRWEACILVHELTEFFIVKHQGIPLSKIDKFDMSYEKQRGCCDFSEPGDAEKCPYRFAHGVASGVERIMVAILGCSWRRYSDKIESL